MPPAKLLEKKIRDLDREIAAAEDYLRLVELTPRPSGLCRLSRDISVYLAARSVERRVYVLRADRDAALACRGLLRPSDA
ncbi:hypothetical protein [Rubrobacter indicoceani]|uniref:hypothetical protein n=1 Tax=Rubrobacter indicoceani TaxID=2051957 RepID=UPI000E5B08CB|nr:hypothetical protein [Rubrobacter indicoceani]